MREISAPEEETGTHHRLRDEPLHLAAEARTAMMVAHRELIRFLRARGRLITGLIQPLAFLLILGVGLSRLVGSSEQVDFVEFMLPGVITMTVVTAAIFSGVSVVWDREFGFLREMLVAPPHRAALVIGKIAGGAVVATAQGALLLLLAPVIGIRLDLLAVLGAIGIAALTAVSLTALGVFLATWIRKMESFQAILQLILMPMIFLSGALFPLRDLPGWLDVLTRLNPLTYAVDPLRQVVLSGQSADPDSLGQFAPGVDIAGYLLPVSVELGIVAAFALLFAALSIRGFGKLD